MNSCQVMDTKDMLMRDVKLSLEIEPKFWSEKPKIQIKFNDRPLFEGYLGEIKTFDWTLPAEEKNRLSIFFLNKTERDTMGEKDKAAIIKSIGIEGFRYSSFMLQSRYEPIYTKGYNRYVYISCVS